MSLPAIGQEEFYEQEESPIENPFLFYTIVAILAIAVYLYARYQMGGSKVRDKIKKTDNLAIGDFVDEEVAKVVGRVMPLENSLIAPFSGKECVYYHLVIEREPSKESKKHIIGLEKVIDEVKCCDFFITDKTGSAKIQASGASISIKKDAKKFIHTFKDDDDQVSEVLFKYGLEEENEHGLKNIYYIREGVLEIGEEVAVVGQGKWQNASSTDTGDKDSKILTFTHTEQTPIYLSDASSTF